MSRTQAENAAAEQVAAGKKTAGRKTAAGKKAAAGKKTAGQKTSRGEKSGAGASGNSPLVSVAAHPRARRQVRQAKGWAGLGGFTVALILSVHASVPTAMAIERAVIAGMAGYLIGWGCALAVWRALLMAELRARAESLKQRRSDAAAAAAAEATPRR